MIASIPWLQFVRFVPKYLNRSILSKDLLATFLSFFPRILFIVYTVFSVLLPATNKALDTVADSATELCSAMLSTRWYLEVVSEGEKKTSVA